MMETWIVLSALSVGLPIIAIYNLLAHFEWDSYELNRMQAMELNLSVIIGLVDDWDYELLIAPKHRSRRYLFFDYSKAILEDAFQILRMKGLTVDTKLLAWALILSTLLLRLKAILFCGRRDLRFICGLELALLRSLS